MKSYKEKKLIHRLKDINFEKPLFDYSIILMDTEPCFLELEMFLKDILKLENIDIEKCKHNIEIYKQIQK